MQRTFIVYVEDKPGVLNRVASLFRRRNFNIDSLTVGRTDNPGVSRMTIVMDTDEPTARRVEANLYRLVNVLYVEEVQPAASVVRELALIKVRADATTRAQVLEVCEVFRARAVDVTPTTLTVEITGTQDKLDGLIEVLRPFEVIEMVRTGAIAMVRGPKETQEENPWQRFITTETPTSNASPIKPSESAS